MKEVVRPWGIFKQFILNKRCTVKILEVNKNEKLSLQKHRKREEMWYFLTPGRVQLGSKKRSVKKGEVVDIKKNVAHRLVAGKNKIEVLEISLGVFSEKDEVRLEDKYGR